MWRNDEMVAMSEIKNRELLRTFKSMLKEKEYRSQDELVYELSLKGFENISQSKVSRLLSKVGAIKVRNAKNNVIYQLSEELFIPRVNFPIDTIVLSIKNNGTQIIMKTAAGGASIIARVLDSLEGSFGILGTISGDDTVLIVPMDTKKIDGVTKGISDFYRISSY